MPVDLANLPWQFHATALGVGGAVYSTSYRMLAEKLNPYAFAVLYQTCCLALYGIVIALLHANGVVMDISATGIGWALVSGVGFGLIDLGIIMFYRTGGEASVGAPTVRIGSLLGAAIVGVLFFAEILSPLKVAGIALAIAGIWLLITAEKKDA